MHNLIKFPPAFFIIYFYKWGYYLLLKLPAILADLGLGLIIHKVIFKLTGSIKRSLLGMAVYIFNPVTVFLSGIWGQTDSLVALFGITSFMLLNTGNVFLSLPLFFLGIYFKPSWAIFAPVYLFLLIVRKSNIRSVIFGILTSLALFIAISAPFAKDSVTTFTWELFTQKIPLPIGILGKASNSAFNFYTMIFRIDIDPAPKIAGLVAYLILNLAAFGALKRQKNTLLGLFTGLFLIGIGSFLFMTSMLERYLFPGLVPLIVLMFARPKLLIGLAIMNIIFFVNIAWSFYRRTSDEIGRPFVVNNFFLIRILSFIQVAIYLRVLKMIQFKRG
jgi:Gpi18-like mannosyltransferase